MFLFANRGLLNALFAQSVLPNINPTNNTTGGNVYYYHPLSDGITSMGAGNNATFTHWAWTGAPNNLMTINFATGIFSLINPTGSEWHYMRCVKYLAAAPPAAP
jgi:hypothetical protein